MVAVGDRRGGNQRKPMGAKKVRGDDEADDRASLAASYVTGSRLSTAAPSDSCVDDLSEITDLNEWQGMEPDNDPLEPVAAVPAQDVGAGGKLVEGPDGRPMRVFRTSAELRQERLRQLRCQEGGAKSRTACASQISTPRSDSQRQTSNQELRDKLAAQRRRASAPTEQVVRCPEGGAKSGTACASQVSTPRSDSQASKQELRDKLEAQRRRASAPAQPVVGRGRPEAVTSLPCGFIPSGQRKGSPKEAAKHHASEEAKVLLDKASREELRDAGLWERMPAKNPVVTQTPGGYHWHIGVKDYQHTLGGIPEQGSLQRTPAAEQRCLAGEEAKRALDKASREELRDAGLWERMPANNPVVTQTPGGYHWHIGVKGC